MERTLITVPNAIPMVAVVGPHDDNLRVIEAAFPSVNITVRGNEITLRGPHIDCAKLENLFNELMVVIRSGNILNVDAVNRAIEMLEHEPVDHPAEVMSLNIVSNRGRTIRPKTANQKKYVDAIEENTITFGIGPAGTGKTYLAGQIGIQHWTKTSGFKGDCLITTDGEDGEMEKITQLLEAKGCPKLAEISKTFKDDLIFSIKAYYQDVYKKWQDESSDEEKEILNPLFDVCVEEYSYCPNTGQQDTRVWKLAAISYLWGPGRIVFDDVRPTINKIYDGVKEYIIYTPLTTYLGLVMVSLSLIMFTAPLFVDLTKVMYDM